RNLLQRQVYTVNRKGNAQTSLAGTLRPPPANVGPRSTPNYDDTAGQTVYRLTDGTKVFAGQRDDPFFVDLGSIFDLGGLRPRNALAPLPRATELSRYG